MLSLSKNHNINYTAKVVAIEELLPHPNADKLQIAVVDYQKVITSLDAKLNDIYVYFPVECKINEQFLSYTNSFSNSEMNADKTKKGFFGKNGRVRSIKLRGETSEGYLVPAQQLFDWVNFEGDIRQFVGTDFDTIGGKLLLSKYVPPTLEEVEGKAKRNGKKAYKEHQSRLIEGQVRFHTDTANLKRSSVSWNADDVLTVSYKLHGTSFWVSNLLVKRKLSVVDKIGRFLGIDVKESEYDILYGSRRMVKNFTFGGFYKRDLWKVAKDRIAHQIPKGFTVYGEAVGYVPETSTFIQKGYDYGMPEGEMGLYVYRITFTNEDGEVLELPTDGIQEFCEERGWKAVPIVAQYKGHSLPDKEALVKELELWKEKHGVNCKICNNKVPAEGYAIRIESVKSFEVYKYKTEEFLNFETSQLDTFE